MKSFIRTQAIVATLCMLGSPAAQAFSAANPSAKATPSRTLTIKERRTDTVRTTAAAPTAATGGTSRWGLGFSSSTAVVLTDSISTIHLLDDVNTIQTYFGIAGTSPFQFGMGGIYKYTVAGSRKGGLHVGGGLGLGTVGAVAAFNGKAESEFFINFLGNAGIHFTVPGIDQLMISFDAGLALRIVDGATNLGIGTYGNVLGMSAHWLL